MKERLGLALAWIALAVSSAHADMGRECAPRALTAAEQAAADKLAERLRNALPAAPAGWAVRDERTDAAAGSCPEDGGAKAIAQPVTVSVLRNYVRKDASQAEPTQPPAQTPAVPVVSAEQVARAKALEQELAELQRKERDASAAYREARRAGDSEAQKQASEASRKLRAEMAPLHRELGETRRLMHRQRAATAAAGTRAAQNRMDEARAHRRDASVSILANLRQTEMRGTREVAVSGVPLAFRDRSGATHLLFGEWRRAGSFVLSRIDESAPTTRVQSLHVRIDANEPATEQLLGALDLKALAHAVDGPGPRPASPQVRAQAQPEASSAQIVLRVGSKDYRFSGPAECKAAPQASIYGINAALYTVSQRSGDQSLRLTLWQPKDGAPAMMSLHVSSGSSRYEVDTVKGGAKRDTRGSGKAVLRTQGAGGTFDIDAKAASGETIAGRITCSSFGGIRAEGG